MAVRASPAYLCISGRRMKEGMKEEKGTEGSGNCLPHFDLHPFGQNMLPVVTKDAKECGHCSLWLVSSLTLGIMLQ